MSLIYIQNCTSDYAECPIPQQFNQRVRNALNADPRSVKLSGLVGSGGLWYGFGRMIMGLWVDLQLTLRAYQPNVTIYYRVEEYQVKELSEVLTNVRATHSSLMSTSYQLFYASATDIQRAPCRYYGSGPTFWRSGG